MQIGNGLRVSLQLHRAAELHEWPNTRTKPRSWRIHIRNVKQKTREILILAYKRKY